MQRVDKSLVEALSNRPLGQELEVSKDYDIRRYVDDFYIFANSPQTLDIVESVLRDELEKFKLYLNGSKRETLSRPFVSNISLARYEIGALVREISRTLRDADFAAGAASGYTTLRAIRSLLSDVRLAIRSHSVQFENVSGWLLGKYRVITRTILRRAEAEADVAIRRSLCEAVTALVDATLYVCAVDTRVRTTYSLCQLVELIQENRATFQNDQYDEVEHSINDGIGGILRTIWTNKSGRRQDSVELYNLLIAGTILLADEFTSQSIVGEILNYLVVEKLTYFKYISVKFCLLKDVAKNKNLLDVLNDKVESHLRSVGEWRSSAEDFLLLSDFLSAPDIASARKRSLFADLVGLNVSKATIESMVPHVGFVDWLGLSVKHLLKRKTLRPVYAWG